MNKEEEENKTFNLKFSRKTDLELLKECLIAVMNFVHCNSEYQQPEFQMDLNFEKPNYKRQRILREQGFLDLLSQVVDSAFPSVDSLNKVQKLKLFLNIMVFYYKITQIEEKDKVISQELKRQNIKAKNTSLKPSKVVSSRKSLWIATKRTLIGRVN